VHVILQVLGEKELQKYLDELREQKIVN